VRRPEEAKTFERPRVEVDAVRRGDRGTRFRRYDIYSGLAFWLYLTRDWGARRAGPGPLRARSHEGADRPHVSNEWAAHAWAAPWLVEPMDVPKVGRIAALRDPQGATFGIIKPDPAS
jgi:hypothetical protein